MVRNWSIRKPHRKTSTHLIESVTIWFLINFYFEHLVNGLMTTSLEKNIKSGKTYSGIFKTNSGASWKKGFLIDRICQFYIHEDGIIPFWDGRSSHKGQPKSLNILHVSTTSLISWIIGYESCHMIHVMSKNCNFKVFKWWSLNFTKSSLSENLRK